MAHNGSSRGFVDPNWPNPNGPSDASIIIYGYVPNFPLTIFASAFFGISLIAHICQLLYHKSWYFATVTIALILEVLGYILRSFSAHKDPYNVLYFVLQYFFIVTAPVFLSAGIYAILSILISRTGRQYSPLPPKWVLGIFITSDAVTTIVQIVGAALIGSSESKDVNPSLGRNILLAGLAVQVLVFLVFVSFLSIFLVKSSKVLWAKKEKRVFLAAFVIATMLVYLRTCFRLAEVAQGVTSYLFTHEDFFAGLEFAPIAAAMALFNIWHPGRCLRRDEKSEAASAEDFNGTIAGE